MGAPTAGWNLPLAGRAYMAGPQDYQPDWITKPARLDPYQAQLEQERIDRIQPRNPLAIREPTPLEKHENVRYEQEALREGLVRGPLGDFTPKYQDVNPFIWNQVTGERDRSAFDEQIALLSAKFPDFASEYANTGQAALWKYGGSSDLIANLGSAYEHYNNPHFADAPPGLLGMTPTMLDAAPGSAISASTGGLLPPTGLLGNA